MGQAIGESVFDAIYLSFAIIAGLFMLIKGKNRLAKEAGLMSALLGFGDAFHLIPRCYALWTTGLEANAAILGVGKLITSKTKTLFYLILYYIWRDYYKIEGRKDVTITMWSLFISRVALCTFPQNMWLSANPPLFWGILRNIPFAVMGIIIIILFYKENKKSSKDTFKYMSIAVALSFLLYTPVVLFAHIYPAVGVLMIPKTLAYVWVIVMAMKLYKENV